MRVGVVGIGKLGKPIAVALDSLGHDVICFDSNQEVMQKHSHPFMESGRPLAPTFDAALRASRLRFWPLDDLVTEVDVILVAVPTPHMEEYDGTHPLPKQRANFDYSFLHRAIDSICTMASSNRRERPLGVLVVSTVLPGTLRYILGTISVPECCMFAYSPSYIAMGTTLADFLDPEFIMIGHVDDPQARSSRYLISCHLAHELYEPLRSGVKRRREAVGNPYLPLGDVMPPLLEMSCESAELAKVCYNTAISAKLAVANVAMELCHKIPGTNIDDISRVLMAAHRRVSSPQYWKGGMGDGGACHPRDNIAMSWLARKSGLGFDIFEAVMIARERQARWFASEIASACGPVLPERACRVLILGYSYKSASNITSGSHALLVYRILTEHNGNVMADRIEVDLHDPVVEGGVMTPSALAKFDVIFLGCAHPGIEDFEFPKGTTVIDPFRIVKPQEGVKVISLGIGPAVV